MTQQFIHALIIGSAAAIIGVTYRNILAKERVLSWWFRFGDRIGKKKIINLAGGEMEGPERWFYRPIWGCEKCFAGQLAGWWYLKTVALPSGVPVTGLKQLRAHVTLYFQNYHLEWHILSISSAVLLAVLLAAILKRLTDEA